MCDWERSGARSTHFHLFKELVTLAHCEAAADMFKWNTAASTCKTR